MQLGVGEVVLRSLNGTSLTKANASPLLYDHLIAIEIRPQRFENQHIDLFPERTCLGNRRRGRSRP